jgi:hypothetical protein
VGVGDVMVCIAVIGVVFTDPVTIVTLHFSTSYIFFKIDDVTVTDTSFLCCFV